MTDKDIQPSKVMNLFFHERFLLVLPANLIVSSECSISLRHNDFTATSTAESDAS